MDNNPEQGLIAFVCFCFLSCMTGICFFLVNLHWIGTVLFGCSLLCVLFAIKRVRASFQPHISNSRNANSSNSNDNNINNNNNDNNNNRRVPFYKSLWKYKHGICKATKSLVPILVRSDVTLNTHDIYIAPPMYEHEVMKSKPAYLPVGLARRTPKWCLTKAWSFARDKEIDLVVLDENCLALK